MWPWGAGFFLQREQILNMDGMVKTRGTDGPPRALFRLVVTLKPTACSDKYSVDAKVLPTIPGEYCTVPYTGERVGMRPN